MEGAESGEVGGIAVDESLDGGYGVADGGDAALDAGPISY